MKKLIVITPVGMCLPQKSFFKTKSVAQVCTLRRGWFAPTRTDSSGS